ncbi:hypothetical protein ACLOJK_029544 [Asimina triloba]
MASPGTKFLALAAFFLVLLSMAHGAIYRTVVTTTETITDDERGSEEQRCRKEMQRHSLGSCRSYLRQQQQVALMMGIGNQQESVPQECCEQMRKVGDDCTCYVLRRMVEEEQEKGEGQGGPGHQKGEILRRAQQIPSQCQLKTRGCEISSTAI